ncbi:sensor histidine kinase [Streptomyces sp. NPDC002889]|uniref:sensor histidine kinase n=1 Tax=Streptomyces sp. NPDC002889 TaxID=3364669 RepID=UPI00367EBFFC
MLRFLRPLARPVTYTRWLHLCIPMAFVAIWMFIDMERVYVVAALAVPVGLLPAVRLEEGIQAQLLLTPHERGKPDASIATAPAATWRDRWRTVLWLEVRLLLSGVATMASVWLPVTTIDLIARAGGGAPTDAKVLGSWEPHWWYALLAVVPIVMLCVCFVVLGEFVTFLARRLLGPSPTERLTALEQRTEQLLERNRIAREIHDSIGHALTVAVVQAGAARVAGDPEFTERALAAIEETGRAALDDLERVLLVLRETGQPVSQRPSLEESDRLLESARASGAKVDAEMTGPLELVPGPVSREGYRILQEALTNVLRHCGPVAVQVRIAVIGERLEMDVTNPLTSGTAPRGQGGSGLRGIRERAALLGGETRTGPCEGEWRVRVRLPLDGLR